MQRLDAIGDDANRIEVEDLGYFVRVVLDLIPCVLHRRRGGPRVLQFEEDQRKSIDVDQNVWPTVVLPVNRQLVYDVKDVVV